MIVLTLFVKIDSNKQLSQSKKILRSYFENLDVDEKILGANSAGWLQLSIDGEDEKIATNYLKDKIGLCPTHKAVIKKNFLFKGRISNFRENKSLSIDIGIFKPQISPVTITLEKIQNQLVKGKKRNLEEISTLFGFTTGFPVNIKVINISDKENQIGAELSEIQLSLFKIWEKSFLDKLIVIGASHNQIKKALNLTRLTKDVINMESLGLFEYALTCKLGTDAAGLIPRIGKILKTAKLTVFNPKRIHLALESKPQLLS